MIQGDLNIVQTKFEEVCFILC